MKFRKRIEVYKGTCISQKKISQIKHTVNKGVFLYVVLLNYAKLSRLIQLYFQGFGYEKPIEL